MGLRIRKSIKIGKNTSINIGKKSLGVSTGMKNLRYSVNTRTGLRTTASLQGTGISYHKQRGFKRKRTCKQVSQEVAQEVTPITKNKWIALILAILSGPLGLHYIYVGKWRTWVIYIITFGGLLIWTGIDCFKILSGNFKDINGNYID